MPDKYETDIPAQSHAAPPEKPEPAISSVNKTGRRNRLLRAAAMGVSSLAILAFLGTALLPPAVRAADEAPVAKAIEPQAPAQGLPSFSALVERVRPAVASIVVKEEQNVRVTNPFKGTPFERFFNEPDSPFNQGDTMRVIMGQGSGFFISADGYIVTNNHVVDGASSVQIKTSDGKTYKAKIIGKDKRTDVALLKVDSDQTFPYVKFASGEPKVGDWVVAMGNPFGLGGTVTAGIVSARGRDIGEGPYDDFLQIDAPVNKGNSGGPTFNQNGEVVGMNTAIYSPSGGSVGIAFAVPSRIVEHVEQQLKDKGYVTRGWLGVQIQNVTPEVADSLGIKPGGALISIVQDNSPAAKAGLKAGDVIRDLNGKSVANSHDLARTVADTEPGKKVSLNIIRDGKNETVELAIGQLKDEHHRVMASNSSSRSSLSSLGLEVAPADEVAGSGDQGPVVTSVRPGGDAQEAGLAEGDVILKVAGKPVNSPTDLPRALNASKDAGKGHALALVERNGKPLFLALPTAAG